MTNTDIQTPDVPDGMIQRPDKSFVRLCDLSAREQLNHDLVTRYFPKALKKRDELTQLKRELISEFTAHRTMMMEDYGIEIGGRDGGMTVRSACGTMMIRLSVRKSVTFGPELSAAEELIDQFLEQELAKGGSEHIAAIINKVFKVNSKGRIDTSGILGLREHRFEDSLWQRAMDAIEDAICRDHSATYVNFYAVDVSGNAKVETLIPLDMAKV